MSKSIQLLRYDVRVQIGLILFLISLYTIFIGGFFQDLINVYAAVAVALILDGAILRFQKKKFLLPHSAVVTGFLVGLILNPEFAAWQFALVSAVAIASKYLVLPGKQHIFNPAAFGLVAASVFFGGAISWWGVAWSSEVWIFISLAAGYVLWKLRRIWLTVGFLLAYWAFLLFNSAFSTAIIYDPTVALFAFIMLPEPRTSPIRKHFMYNFGILVAIIMIIYLLIFPNLKTDPLLLSLLTANLLTFVLIKLKPKLQTS